MAEIAVAPFTFTGAVTLSANGYTAHITRAELTPSKNGSKVKDIGGTAHVFGGKSDWTLDGDAFQDVTTVNSLTMFALANDGQSVAGTMTVNGVEFDFTCVVHALKLGGTPGADPASSSFSFDSTAPVPADD